MQQWPEALQSRHSEDITYLDFKKAFDSVAHNQFLTKLQCYGIHDNIMGWLAKFLSQRKQRVNMGGILSNIAPATSGVPRAVCLALHSFHYTSTIYLTYSKIMVLFANYLLMMLSSIASQLRPKPNYSLLSTRLNGVTSGNSNSHH